MSIQLTGSSSYEKCNLSTALTNCMTRRVKLLNDKFLSKLLIHESAQDVS